MPYDIRFVSTYPPRRCGVGTFTRDLANGLEHFAGEVGQIRVAAIDNNSGPYNIPVDLTIEQYSPESWSSATGDIMARAQKSANPTVAIFQHEYGLDPDKNGEDSKGTNFVDMAKAFSGEGLTTLVQLHTVLDEPNDHQKRTLRELAEFTDGLVLTSENAMAVLESSTYEIDHSKLKHIDHGVRMQHASEYDRLAIKEKYGLEDFFLATTLGLLSPDKGIQYSIRAYGRFLKESCTDDQRERIVYLIAGQCHPDFIRAAEGREYRAYQATLAKALKESGLKWCKAQDPKGLDFGQYDVVFLDTFLDESTFLELYGATNVMVLPYLNMFQTSSGILADTLGSSRVAIATKFNCALELIHSNRPCPSGLVIGRYARGILVDPGEASVEQMAGALDFLVFNQNERLTMEKEIHQRGFQMQWNNIAWALLQHIKFVIEEKELVIGRSQKFTRDKTSIYHSQVESGDVRQSVCGVPVPSCVDCLTASR
jgi:glycosyltransferase involved in cell wall biosynthesis